MLLHNNQTGSCSNFVLTKRQSVRRTWRLCSVIVFSMKINAHPVEHLSKAPLNDLQSWRATTTARLHIWLNARSCIFERRAPEPCNIQESLCTQLPVPHTHRYAHAHSLTHTHKIMALISPEGCCPPNRKRGFSDNLGHRKGLHWMSSICEAEN